MKTPPEEIEFEVPWHLHPRIAVQHLGREKYSTSTRAIAELIANGFDAGATTVNVDIRANDLGGAEGIVVSDDGRGMTAAEIRERFSEVGVTTDAVTLNRFGKFGVGRMAVYRIGDASTWTTVSAAAKRRMQFTFTLRYSDHLQLVPLKVRQSIAGATPTGTVINIDGLVDTTTAAALRNRITSDLLTQFCSYLLAHTDKRIRVDGEELDVHTMVIRREHRDIPGDATRPAAKIDHLLLDRPITSSRIQEQLLFTTRGRTVFAAALDDPPTTAYLGLVESDYLRKIVTSNNESVMQLDDRFNQLRSAAIEAVAEFGESLREERGRNFIEEAREKPYYPYRGVPSDAVSKFEQVIYDEVLEKVNEHANIASMSGKQQQVIFFLLKRAISNDDLWDILHEIAKLSDTDIEAFRRLLGRSTLASVIRLGAEVTNRLDFLDVLHEVVYGDGSKSVKERKQLHKILEPNGWLFGPQFHLATSDRGFRNVVRKHRELAGLDPVPDDDFDFDGADDIPDLFLAASREYPTRPSHRNLLVEIKRPSKKIGIKEIEQGRSYATTVLNSPQFETQDTDWQVFVVSSAVNEAEVAPMRNPPDRAFGEVYRFGRVSVWAFTWSEIITAARDEMRFVREHLKRKSDELLKSHYLQEQFPDVFPADVTSVHAVEDAATVSTRPTPQ